MDVVLAEQGDEVGIVRDADHRAPFGDHGAHQCDHVEPGVAVLPEGRLVEEDHPWRGGQDGADAEAALLAARQGERVRPGQADQVEALEQLVGAQRDLGVVQ